MPADRERGQLEAGDQDRPGDPGPRVPHQRARAGAPAARRPRRGVHQGQEEVHEERGGVHQEAQREAALGLRETSFIIFSVFTSKQPRWISRVQGPFFSFSKTSFFRLLLPALSDTKNAAP